MVAVGVFVRLVAVGTRLWADSDHLEMKQRPPTDEKIGIGRVLNIGITKGDADLPRISILAAVLRIADVFTRNVGGRKFPVPMLMGGLAGGKEL